MDGTCRSVASYKILKEAGTKSLGAYIDKQQATVSEWVALGLILEVCDKKTGYEGVGRRRGQWWWQMAARKQLISMLKYI